MNTRKDLLTYINYIVDGILPLNKYISSKQLPIEVIKYARHKRNVYKSASEIIRSQKKRVERRRYNDYKIVYKYFKEHHPNSKFVKLRYGDLNLKDFRLSKYFTIPNLRNLTINLSYEFFAIKDKFIIHSYCVFNENFFILLPSQ